MSVLYGLPDFGARQPTDGFELCAPYEPGPFLLWPNGLDVKRTALGRPDLQLVFVRTSGAGADYGALDFGIERVQPSEGALTWLRRGHPGATLAMVPFESGFVRLVAGPDLVNVPPDLQQPSPLGWGGIDSSRFNLRLSSDSASIVKAGLTSTLAISVRLEVEVRGVAPRVPATVVFDPAALLGPLVPAGASSRQIPRSVLDEYFLDAPGKLPLVLEGDPPSDRAAFAQAMAGRVRAEFGRFVPSPTAAGPSYLELAELPHGSVRWNLAEPAVVRHAWVFTLDPFTAARELARVAGIDAVYREVTKAPLPLGFFDVDVQAFLPPTRLGVVELGVELAVPARPPFRPAADSRSVPLVPPGDHGVAHFRLSPFEKLSYAYTTYAAVSERGKIRRLDGESRNETTQALALQAHDLPIDLLELSADPALLAVAGLSGALGYTAPSGAQVATSFALDAARPRTSVALPRDAASATLTADARPLDGAGAAIRLGPMPAAGQHFTLASFAGYGAHQVSIACAFDPGAAGPFAIDLVADGQPDAPANITTVFLTRDAPTKDWTYVAVSPFRAGYRWRAHPGGSWSAPLAPGARLELTAPGGPVAQPTIWNLRGVHLHARPGDPPGRVRYVPGDPAPQLDNQGRPTLLLLDTASRAVLSLGTRLEVSDAERADLEVDLLTELTAVDRIDFQPAPFTVGAVTLSLGDGAGGYTPLGTVPSMGAPPYNATFSVQLDADQRARVIAALGGAPRSLKVDYPIALPPEVAATFDGAPAAITRTTDVATWFAGGTGSAHIQRIG
jgi:hypothetical protein